MKQINLKRLIFFLKNYFSLFLFLILLLLPLGYHFFLKMKENFQCNFPSPTLVTKVIDGDTILLEGGKVLRILGIDADEKGYPCFEESKRRLESILLNKKVKIERGKKSMDQYGRCLGYVFLNGKNIGLSLVQEGLAVCRGSKENIKYEKECEKAEKEARESQRGCKWAKVDFSSEKIIHACEAKKYYGEEKVVEGRVADVYLSKNNNLFLNLEKRYPYQCLSVVIFSSYLKNFSSDFKERILGKKIRIKGLIKKYKGKPEIIVSHPNQIEILEY